MKARTRAASASLGPATPIVIATAVLFVLSPIVVPGSLSTGALSTMLPFASFLAVAAVGQTLVIQQGGLDFSVAGTISLSAVLLTKYADQSDGRLVPVILLVAVVAMSIGAVNGFFVTRLNVTPIIATLGVNALVLGVTRKVSGGLSVPPAPDSLRSFSLGTTLGLRNPLLVAICIILAVTFVVKATVIGRRFEVVGSNSAAARVAGIQPTRHQMSAYVLAGLCYAIAGVLLAGYLTAPGIAAGEPYLLSTIAAGVIGGTSITGGSGTAIGAGMGALFLTQLSQLLIGSGLDSSVNLVVQGAAIAVAMTLRTVASRASEARRSQIALARAEAADRQPMTDADLSSVVPESSASVVDAQEANR